MPWYLNPKNLLLAALAVALVLMWLALGERDIKIAECQGSLSSCNTKVESLQTELSDATSVIAQLKANVSSIKQQMAKWQKIAKEAEDYAKRLLEATEAKVECEVYHEGNARLVDEFVDSFNAYSVRRKITSVPSGASDSSAPAVLPKASDTDADKGNK